MRGGALSADTTGHAAWSGAAHRNSSTMLTCMYGAGGGGDPGHDTVTHCAPVKQPNLVEAVRTSARLNGAWMSIVGIT